MPFLPAISEPGWTRRKKPQLGFCLNQRDRAALGNARASHPAKPTKIFDRRGCLRRHEQPPRRRPRRSAGLLHTRKIHHRAVHPAERSFPSYDLSFPEVPGYALSLSRGPRANPSKTPRGGRLHTNTTHETVRSPAMHRTLRSSHHYGRRVVVHDERRRGGRRARASAAMGLGAHAPVLRDFRSREHPNEPPCPARSCLEPHHRGTLEHPRSRRLTRSSAIARLSEPPPPPPRGVVTARSSSPLLVLSRRPRRPACLSLSSSRSASRRRHRHETPTCGRSLRTSPPSLRTACCCIRARQVVVVFLRSRIGTSTVARRCEEF